MANIAGNLPSTLNRSRSSIVFLNAETTAGTIAAHPTTLTRFGLTTPPVIGQAGNYTDTSEIGPELISVDRVLNYMDYSSFDFEYYAKPGGVTDTALAAPTGLAGTLGSASVTVTTAGVVAVGDTVLIAGNTDTDASLINGLQIVKTTNSGVDFTFDASAVLTANATTHAGMSVSKRVITESEEGDIIFRVLGGRKYMSTAHNGYYQGTPSSSNAAYVAPYTTITSSNASTIQYYLANAVNTFTVTSRQFTDQSVQMYTATGALPTSWSVSLAKDGPVTFTTGFQSNRVYYTGTAEVDNSGPITLASGADTVVTVTAPKRHASNSEVNAEDIAFYQSLSTLGSLVKVRDSAGAEQGPFEVVAISGATVTLDTDNSAGNGTTGSGSALPAGNTFLIPYTPEPCPDTTSILDQRSVQVYMTDQLTGSGMAPEGTANTQLFHVDNAMDVTAVSFDFDRSVTTPGLTEMTGEEFPPASYVINEPTITGSLTLLLRPKDFQLMNSIRAEPHRAIGVEIGTTAGNRIQIAAPSCFLEVPTPGDADGATQIDIPFTVVRGAECEDADKFMVRYF